MVHIYVWYLYTYGTYIRTHQRCLLIGGETQTIGASINYKLLAQKLKSNITGTDSVIVSVQPIFLSSINPTTKLQRVSQSGTCSTLYMLTANSHMGVQSNPHLWLYHSNYYNSIYHIIVINMHIQYTCNKHV